MHGYRSLIFTRISMFIYEDFDKLSNHTVSFHSFTIQNMAKSIIYVLL